MATLIMKLDGSTLVEVLVSMVIMAVILGMSGLIIDIAWNLGENEISQKAKFHAQYGLFSEVASNDSLIVSTVNNHSIFPEVSVYTVVILSQSGDTLSKGKKIISNE